MWRLIISILPPILLTTSIIPERVGFSPVFFITKSEPFTIKPAAIKNAAEEISPTISIFFAVNREGFIVTSLFSLLMSTPNYLSINSVWFLERLGSITFVCPSAFKPASRIHDLTCALASFEL